MPRHPIKTVWGRGRETKIKYWWVEKYCLCFGPFLPGVCEVRWVFKKTHITRNPESNTLTIKVKRWRVMVGYCPSAHGRTCCPSPRRLIPVNSKQSCATATAALVAGCGGMDVRPRAGVKKIHTFKISYGRPWQVNREMSIAQLFDCFTCHRFLRAPPGEAFAGGGER